MPFWTKSGDSSGARWAVDHPSTQNPDTTKPPFGPANLLDRASKWHPDRYTYPRRAQLKSNVALGIMCRLFPSPWKPHDTQTEPAAAGRIVYTTTHHARPHTTANPPNDTIINLTAVNGDTVGISLSKDHLWTQSFLLVVAMVYRSGGG